MSVDTTEYSTKSEAPVSPVRAWEESCPMPSYMPAQPDTNPMFLETRVYQGSSGRVYPLPVVDRIACEPVMRHWRAVHLENEFLRLMILPELGGRIHAGLDKRTGYDFFYRQDVIKPALVGLAGPWISGGVEFNWPQHHRPATFMPVEVEIEHEPDGAVTVWCSDHDPMARMKGMHGLRLRPGVAVLEVRVRLYNRTEDTQTFLWWANVATEVHEAYRSFFPSDVRFAADHAKRALTAYPLCEETYYGVDYGRRGREGVAGGEVPARFVPQSDYAANDLGWYANIPVPTSYMIAGSRGDFFGGYDYKKRAGTVAVANHHIAPGKKQWTWGNHEFGYAWDRHLSDDERPYVELMSGAYTDNQPDFAFLAPGETKSFSQFWYPIGDSGVPTEANLEAAMRVERGDGALTVHVQVMRSMPHCTLLAIAGGVEQGRWTGKLSPETILHHTFARWPEDAAFEIQLRTGHEMVLRYAPAELREAPAPELAQEPEAPEAIGSSDELFLTGLHLEQYRHPTRQPEAYWKEALRRDPGDSRSNHAMGRWHLRRGEFAEAEQRLRLAVRRLTEKNPNPYDGEPYYNLGRVLRYQGRDAEAYDALYKSTWNAAWRGPGYQRLAEIDCARGDWTTALEHVGRSLNMDADNLLARNLQVLVLRRLGRALEAEAAVRQTRAMDPLDGFARWLESGVPPKNGQQRLDLAFDLLRAGCLEETLEVVSEQLDDDAPDGARTLLLYVRAATLEKLGQMEQSAAVFRQAAAADPAYVFPSRLEEMLLLQHAMEQNRDDARAPYYLGNLLYDRKRHREAIALWERSTTLDPGFPTTWRNLGFGYFNVLGDAERARSAFARARAQSPDDARLLFEQDQLLKRTGEPLDARLRLLEEDLDLVARRDDLSVELAALENSLGRPEAARTLLLARSFQPWEGGEGKVLTEFVRSSLLLAHGALRSGEAGEAVQLLEEALRPPVNLGEQWHLLANTSAVAYWLGQAWQAAGDPERARMYSESAARQTGDFQQMAVQPVSEMTYWSARARRSLGQEDAAVELFARIRAFAAALRVQPAKVDYFATSLPTMLLFQDDLDRRQQVLATFLEAQAQLGLRDVDGGRRALQGLLAMDPSHAPSADLLRLEEN